MNIFYLNPCPATAARMQCDQHVVKMILETGQLLCTAHNILGDGEAPYKITHRNHPSAVWVRESTGNYNWLFAHLLGLVSVYNDRFHKRHKTENILDYVANVPDCLENGEFFEPPQCMPDEYKSEDSAVTGYQRYYCAKAESWFQSGNIMRFNRKRFINPVVYWESMEVV